MYKLIVVSVCAIVSMIACGEQRLDRKSSAAVKVRKPLKCALCSGTGSVVVTTREPCEDCSGTGVIVTDVELSNKTYAWERNRDTGKTKKSKNRQGCKTCKRSGKITVKKEQECPRCKGAGEY